MHEGAETDSAQSGEDCPGAGYATSHFYEHTKDDGEVTSLNVVSGEDGQKKNYGAFFGP